MVPDPFPQTLHKTQYPAAYKPHLVATWQCNQALPRILPGGCATQNKTSNPTHMCLHFRGHQTTPKPTFISSIDTPKNSWVQSPQWGIYISHRCHHTTQPAKTHFLQLTTTDRHPKHTTTQQPVHTNISIEDHQPITRPSDDSPFTRPSATEDSLFTRPSDNSRGTWHHSPRKAFCWSFNITGNMPGAYTMHIDQSIPLSNTLEERSQ